MYVYVCEEEMEVDWLVGLLYVCINVCVCMYVCVYI